MHRMIGWVTTFSCAPGSSDLISVFHLRRFMPAEARVKAMSHRFANSGAAGCWQSDNTGDVKSVIDRLLERKRRYFIYDDSKDPDAWAAVLGSDNVPQYATSKDLWQMLNDDSTKANYVTTCKPMAPGWWPFSELKSLHSFFVANNAEHL